MEDSSEEFILSNLPRLPGTKPQVCPLFTDHRGDSYFRVKFWKYDDSGLVTTRKEVRSHFVVIQKVDGVRRLVDKSADGRDWRP